MHRTLVERAKGTFGPEAPLRRLPRYGSITLTSKGRIIAEIPNLLAVPEDVSADLVQSGIVIARRGHGATVTAPESEFGALMHFVRANDALVISAVARGDTPADGWDTGEPDAAMLAQDAVAIHVAQEIPHIEGETQTDGGRVVLVAPDAMNKVMLTLEDVTRRISIRKSMREGVRDQRWIEATSECRVLPFISVIDNVMIFTLKGAHETMVQPLLDKGAQEIKYGIVQIHRKHFLDANLKIAEIKAEYERIQNTPDELLSRSAIAPRQEFEEENSHFSM